MGVREVAGRTAPDQAGQDSPDEVAELTAEHRALEEEVQQLEVPFTGQLPCTFDLYHPGSFVRYELSTPCMAGILGRRRRGALHRGAGDRQRGGAAMQKSACHRAGLRCSS